jgi:hypothetical protein
MLLCGCVVATGASGGDVPAYLSAEGAKKPQRATVPPEHFADPQVKRAYSIPKKMPAVLAQQPCYCWCSRMGHHGLLSCYQDEHASQCSICMKEAFLADQLTRRGKTPEQIREAVIRGDWRSAE